MPVRGIGRAPGFVQTREFSGQFRTDLAEVPLRLAQFVGGRRRLKTRLRELLLGAFQLTLQLGQGLLTALNLLLDDGELLLVSGGLLVNASAKVSRASLGIGLQRCILLLGDRSHVGQVLLGGGPPLSRLPL